MPNITDFPPDQERRNGLRAELIGSNTAIAVGITAIGYAPVLMLCRSLIVAGYDPTTPLTAYRGVMLCLTVRSIGEAAKYTVKDNRFGIPTLHRWQRGPPGAATASPIRLNGGELSYTAPDGSSENPPQIEEVSGGAGASSSDGGAAS